MPLMVTRPVIDRIASVTRVRWRSVVASRHWLRQAQTIIMSGMGGFSSCELGLGCPYSTRSSTALPHTHFGEGIAPNTRIYEHIKGCFPHRWRPQNRDSTRAILGNALKCRCRVKRLLLLFHGLHE